jgi:hypothetical protein
MPNFAGTRAAVILAAFAGACEQRAESTANDTLPSIPASAEVTFNPYADEELVPFDPSRGAGITPQVLEGTMNGEYSLSYILNDTASAITTRMRGASDPLSAGLSIDRTRDYKSHKLVAFPGYSDTPVTLARWNLDDEGHVCDMYVRTSPVIEIRPHDLKEGEISAKCDWRPIVNGQPQGYWRVKE